MDGTSPETCGECGFDSRAWLVRDAASLFGGLGTWWRQATAATPAADLNRRPAPEVWSVLEYGLHTALVTAVIREGIERILEEDGCALPAPPDPGGAGGDDVAALDPEAVLAAVAAEGDRLAGVAGRRGARWANTGRMEGATIQAEAGLVHAAHDAGHHFMDVARGLSAVGAGTPPDSGWVAQINLSDGGIPKHQVAAGQIGWGGLEEDRQGDRKHHGRAFQALCLWSAEVITDLAGAGHSLAPGRAGENLTVAGLDWSALRPGTRIGVGRALLELSFPAVPCYKQAQWFSDGDFSRMDHDLYPEAARWYAWVRRPGRVELGDQVMVSPAGSL